MILIDTSIWIRFLSNQVQFAGRLDALLGRGEVIGHELIYGELLIGDRGGRAKFQLWTADPRFAAILRDCPQAAELVRDLEYIAETARMLMEPEGEAPSSDLWSKIESQIKAPEESDSVQ